MNELLWFAMLIVNFLLILFLYRFAGKTGLLIWVPIATIIANIQVVKMVHLFGMEATLGNVVYASSFLVTDILSENYDQNHAKRAVCFGFFSMIVFTLLMNMALLFTPSENDFTHGAMQTIFTLMPRITLASLAAYLVSQFHDIYAYQFWKKKFPELRHLWLRNNLSTMVSQALDTLIFTLIAFTGLYSGEVLLEICLATYLLKWVVALLDTPFIYLARAMKEKGCVGNFIE